MTPTDEQLATDAAIDFIAAPIGIPSSFRALTPAQARRTHELLMENPA